VPESTVSFCRVQTAVQGAPRGQSISSPTGFDSMQLEQSSHRATLAHPAKSSGASTQREPNHFRATLAPVPGSEEVLQPVLDLLPQSFPTGKLELPRRAPSGSEGHAVCRVLCEPDDR
jgi:hypothetical protein